MTGKMPQIAGSLVVDERRRTGYVDRCFDSVTSAIVVAAAAAALIAASSLLHAHALSSGACFKKVGANTFRYNN